MEELMCFLPMQEEWKAIEGYNNNYQISNYGRVNSLCQSKPRILSLQEKDGYLMANLRRNKKTYKKEVHNLVARAFVGERPVINGERYVIDHKDENKLNNCSYNLRYITTRENTSRSIRGGSSSYVGVSRNKAIGKWRASIVINKKSYNLGDYDNEIDASDAYQSALKDYLENQHKENNDGL